MTKEELEKEAKEKAEELSKKHILGAYELKYDEGYYEGYNEGEVVGYEEGYFAGAESREKRIAELERERNIKEGKIYELSMKITELQELLTDCLFYCEHIDSYYNECLREDNIFERASKLGVKYNV